MSMNTDASRPRLFLSYAHLNPGWRDLFLAKLEPLTSKGAFEVWHDGHIEHGDDWFERIAVEIQRSRFTVILLTAEFLSSDFIRTRELPYIEQIRVRQDLTIYPWVCEPCGWQQVSLFSEAGSRIQCRPADSALSDHDDDAVHQMLDDWIATLGDRGDALIGRPRLAMQREEATNAFARGKASLDAHDYRSASESFEEAERLTPDFADAHYFHALALLAGRRAKKVDRRTITGVTQHLQAAIEARGSFSDYLMLALFKWDYYRENRLRMPEPPAEQLLESADTAASQGNFDRAHLEETFQHTPWIDNAVTRWLAQWLAQKG